MITRVRAVAVAIVCGVCACTAGGPPGANHDPPASRAPAVSMVEQTVAGDEQAVPVARMMIKPTAEMLQAALTNDPDVMRGAVINSVGSCQAPSTCPPEFGACTNWSSPNLCNSVCGNTFCICRPIRFCEGEPPEPRGVDTFDSYRVCFDPNQNGCTEWSNTVQSFCGC